MLLLLSTTALQAAEPSVRPKPQIVSPLASPYTETRVIDAETEGQAFLKTLDPALRKALEKDGQVLLGEDKSTEASYGGYIKAVALFTVPKARAYELIVEPVKQPLYLPRLVSAQSIEKPAHGELVNFHLKVMFTSIRFFTQHWFYPELSRVEWKLDPTRKNDIAGQEGFWQLYAVGPNLTVGEYGTRVDTGIAVPKAIQDFLARRDIPKALDAFRAYVNSNGTYRRD